jgi:hypothetical protein
MPFKKKSDWSSEKIKALIDEGKSLTEIGEVFGISRQRVKQICQKYKLPNTVLVKQKIKQAKYFDKWGNKSDTDLYAVCRRKFFAKKNHAKRVGIDWDIKFGAIEWPEKCPILGIELNYFAEERQDASPSFDRTDPSKGYVAGNVRIISWRANRLKNDGSAKEHRLIAEYLDNLAEDV